jgi:alkanesulfonate monooxygenase SsuD/methylene tetrahydromethanopterin reductase-like flavin-dependent oxidoreductase (luciferase family)
MRIGLLQGAHCPPGVDPAQRYREILDEAVLAEQAGFDFYAVPEQHFDPGGLATNIPASEQILSVVADRTSTIRLIWLSAVLPIHHPLRVAEAVATLDILSEGRIELATARSNDLPTLRAFEVNPATTRDRWREALEIVVEALSRGAVEHHGENWDIPEVKLNPKPIQTPHPPLLYASTSVEGHRQAGALGLGVVGGNSLPGGWDYVARCARTYKEAVAQATPLAGRVTDSLYSFAFAAHVADTQRQAEREAEATVASIIELVNSMFTRLAKQSSGYEYMDEIRAIYERRHDLAYLNERAPYISIGTPSFMVERLKRLEELGYDGIALRIDGMPHEVCQRSIETFGERVLPELAARPASTV